MSATIDDKKLNGAGLATLWGIIKQYIVDNPSIPKATASTLGCIMVGTTLGVNNSGVLNLASGVVTAGTYKSVTVDTYGRVTAGANPNTLAGYGITDAKISNGSIILGENSITPITSLSGYATQTWVQNQGYLTEETYKGTVTQVKVGTTAYDPTSGVVSLPAYPTTLPASDVYSWAKAASKPSYTASEVGAATSGHTHTTNIATSSAENQLTLAFGTKYAISAGGTSYVFTMPANPDTWRPLGTGANDACAGNDSRLSDSRPASDVYSWAKASAKPSYTYSEVGAASSGHTHTTSLASDSGTSTITLASAGKYKLTAGGTSVIFTMPTIPTVSYPVTSVNSKTGAVTLTASDVGAATSGHTHTLSIATSSGTNALTLAANTKYVLTAGGSTFIFTTPEDTNTWRPLGTGATDACAGNDSRLSDSRPASDVYSWAKASSKPSYSYSEISGTPSSLPASDVYSWAKASTKPSYNFGEIGTGAATIGDGANYLLLRSGSGWQSGMYHHTTGDEAFVFANVNSRTSWIFANTDPTGRADWTGLSPYVQIKKGCVYINSLIASGTDPSYNLYVNGSMYVTSINGVNVGSSPKFTDTTYSAATQSAAGLMSAADKTKLDGIASGANAYSLPAASTSALGGIKVNYTNSGKNYKVQLDSSNNAYVNVPWENTTYTFTNKGATLAWSTTSTIATVGGVDIKVTMPANPNTDHYAWSDITGKPSTFTPSSHTHSYIEAKSNYTFDSGTLPNSFDYGISAGFVNSNSGFGSYGSVLTVRTYSEGGGSLQLYAPYSSTYGGTHMKARFGNYASSGGNSWTDLKEVAWVSDIPTNNNQLTNGAGYITGITKSMVTTALGYTPPTSDTNTWRTVQCNGTSIGNNTLNLKAGTNVSLSNSNGTITITSTDTNTWRPIGTGASDAAAGNHTHGLSIATSTGTNALTLAANTKYVLTAGGSTFIFTTPPDNNTTYSVPTKVSQLTNDSGYITSSASITGNAANVTGTVAIGHGGTGATTAAAARANLGTWALISDSYDTLIKADGSTNGWIKIGTANSNYGLLPSTTGEAGSGHNYIGTSSWYWKYAYIDQIYGYLNGSISGNAATATKATNDSDGNAINSTYLKLTGGTMNSNATIGGVGEISTNTSNPNVYFKLNTDSYSWWVGVGISNADDRFVIYNASDSIHTIGIEKNGNVGIGTSRSGASYKLHVNGVCAATSFTNISDIRTKNMLSDKSYRIDNIANAPIFQFTWKDTKIDSDLHIGSSAQYWKTIMPEAVTTAKDEMNTLSMQYDVIALASVVSVAKETLTLKEKVALLETRVESLEKKIREYESN